jgi:hypothetical protein
MTREQSKIKLASDGNRAIAVSLSTLSTSDQFRKMRELSTLLKTDLNQLSLSMFECKYDELSKSGAADVISRLEILLSETRKDSKIFDMQEFIKAKGMKSPE